MAKNFRRMFAMVMVLCMILSALPMQALAEETTHDGLTITITPSEGSGSSGGESGGSGSSGSGESSGSGSSGSGESSGSGSSGSGESSSSSAPTSKVEVSGTSTSTGATVNMNGTQTETSSSTNSTSTENSTTTTTTSESNIVLSGTATESDGTQKQISYEGTNTETETKEVTKDEATGNTTTNTTTDVTWKGTEQDGDITKAVSGKETTEESSTTNAEGEEIASDWEVNGEETKEWTEEDSGDKPGQPKVDVVLKPGETTTGAATTTETTGDVQNGENDTQYNYTETTTTDRTVTASTSDITVTESEYLDFDLKPIEFQRDPNAEDVNWYNTEPRYTNLYDKIAFGDEIRWVPRFERRADQMLPELMNYYTEKVTTVTDEDNNPVTVKTYVPKEGGSYSTNHGEFFLFDVGANASSSYKMLHESRDDENGSYLILVCDEFGNILPTYCMDEVTSTNGNYAYILENLDDATYFEGTAEEQQAAKDQVRAIALKGYWGAEDGMGSLDQIKADMKAFIENNPDFAFTYTVDPATVAEGEEMPADQTFSAADNKEYLLQLIDLLNEGGALTVTQSAIWEYGRGIDTPEIVYKKGAEESFNQALTLFREYLLSEALQETAQLKETVIYDQDSFLVEDSLKLTVGDKISDSEANTNEDADDDVYNVDMSFKLVVAPGEKDDLVVCLVDSNNTIVRKARIAGDAVEGETSDEIIVGEDGSYTFTDVPLQENSDITFNLKLEGIQYLEKGVYIYKAVKNDGTTDYGHAQTLIGVGEGSHEVDVTTAFTVNFSVDEDNHIVTKTVWHYEDDPSYKPSTPPEYPVTPMNYVEEDVPAPQVFRLNNNNLVEIPEEPVPLATPAITGDTSGLWVAVILIALCGIVAVNVFDKKRQHESF